MNQVQAPVLPSWEEGKEMCFDMTYPDFNFPGHTLFSKEIRYAIGERCKMGARKYLLDYFYFEGELKDYYFADKNPLNDYLTIYTHFMSFEKIRTAIRQGLARIERSCEIFPTEVYFDTYRTIDLLETSLKVDAVFVCYKVLYEGNHFLYPFTITRPHVLEESLQKDAERWEEYRDKRLRDEL